MKCAFNRSLNYFFSWLFLMFIELHLTHFVVIDRVYSSLFLLPPALIEVELSITLIDGL